MNVVVAGGTGFVGRHICEALLEQGHDVATLSRHPDGATLPDEVEARAGDVTDPGSLRGALDGADAVIGVVQFPNYPVQVARKGLTFDRFDRRGTEHLLAEARRAGVSRYVYLSGAGADITSPRPWYRAKGLAERAVTDSGLDFAIVRPSWAYGPDDRALNRFAQIARYSPVVPRLGVRTQLVQPVHVDDIARCVADVLASADAWGRVIEIGGPDVLSMHRVIATMLEVLDLKRVIVPVPIPLAKLGTAPLLLLPAPPMSPGGIGFAVGDAVVDNSTLRELLGIEPVALVEGLSRYLGR